MASLNHVRDSVQRIDKTSWLIGSKHIIRHHLEEPRESECILWKNTNDGSCYTLSDASPALRIIEPVSFDLDGHVHQIHDAGDSSAVFSFGDALILKVKLIRECGPQEYKTLAFLARYQRQLSFNIPSVLFHFQEANKTYLFEPYLPGRRLNEAWKDMDTNEKDYISTRVANICSELAAFRSNDMLVAADNWINPFRKPEQSDHVLRRHWEDLGMDCSTFMFSHNDLAPTNIFIHEGQITIIDWELAGYYPLAWMRTKFAICAAFDTEQVSGKNVQRDNEYRLQVERKLGDMGYPAVTHAYRQLFRLRYKECEKQWL